jgi:hypothetical protein
MNTSRSSLTVPRTPLSRGPVTTLSLHKTTTARHFGFNAGDWLVFLLGLALACSLVMLI